MPKEVKEKNIRFELWAGHQKNLNYFHLSESEKGQKENLFQN